MEYKTTNKITEDVINTILEVKDTHGLTPEAVVEEAKNPESPLHHIFDWDDTVAAHKWRLQQARVLINEIEIVVENGTVYPAFENVTVVLETTDNSKETERQYFSRPEIMAEPNMREQVIRRAMAQAVYWKHQYSSYQELSPIFEAISEVGSRIKEGAQ